MKYYIGGRISGRMPVNMSNSVNDNVSNKLMKIDNIMDDYI